MDDLSTYLKKGFQKLHQQNFEKDYKQKTIKYRRDDNTNMRRKTRDTLMLQKRNIDINNMSPYCTPEPHNKKFMDEKEGTSKNEPVPPVSKRLQMLKKWKEEKEKKKMEEKKKVKPLFKITHVPVNVGLPNLENVNKEIKGKPIKKTSFAPNNHTFKPPKNVKDTANFTKECKTIETKSQGKNVPNLRRNGSTETIAKTQNINYNKTRIQKEMKTHETKSYRQHIDIKNKGKAIENGEFLHINVSKMPKQIDSGKEIKTEVTIPNNFKSKPKKNVMWNQVEVIESNDHITTRDLNIKTPKRQYNKTPIKKNTKHSEDDSECDQNTTRDMKNKTPKRQYNKTPLRKNTKHSEDEAECDQNTTRDMKNKTPIKNKTPKRQYNKTPIKNNIKNSEDEVDYDSDDVLAGTKKMNASISYDNTPTPKRTQSFRTSSICLEEEHELKQNISDEKLSHYFTKQPPSSSNIKTPSKNNGQVSDRRRSRRKTIDTELTNEVSGKETKKLKRSLSLEEIAIPTKMTPMKTSPKRKSSTYKPESKEEIYNEPNDIPSESCSSNSDEDDFISTRECPADEYFHLNNQLNNTFEVEDSSQKRETKVNVTPDKNVLYSDDEITLKTPKKTPRNSRKSACKPMEENVHHQQPVESTPKRKGEMSEPVVYISPFVTISRGKESARKEFRIRSSHGGSLPDAPEFSNFVKKHSSPTASAAYFRKRLDDEIDRIKALCLEWTAFKQEIPDDVQDMVDAAIGQSNLLLTKKFQQFRNLISLCEEGSNNGKPVTCADLHGYWDTMYMQVEDIDKRFNRLKTLKDNAWTEILIPDKSVPIKRGKGRSKKVAAQSKIKDMIKNARLRKNNANNLEENNDSTIPKTEVTITKPSPRIQLSATKTKRLSLRVSAITNEARKRTSSSPGLTIMRVSQSLKFEAMTPGKSILKTDNNRSERKVPKSVLFKDLDEDKENDLMSFSPVTPRRSRRLSMASAQL